MKMLLFDFRDSEKEFFEENDLRDFEIEFIKEPLNERTVLTERQINETDAISVFISSNVTEEVIKRLAGRRVCPSCGGSFNVELKPPKKEGICDFCGANLVQRKDDNPDSLKVRLEEYHKNTQPVIEYYEEMGIVRHVDASMSKDEVYDGVKNILEGLY